MSTHRDKRGDSQMLPVMVLLRAAQRGGQPTVVSFMGPSLGPMILFFHLGGPPCLLNTGRDTLQFASRFDLRPVSSLHQANYFHLPLEKIGVLTEITCV
jgi:hypothetical protein